MQNFCLKLIVLSVIVSYGSISAFAWDEVGHKLTGIIAWQHMTPEVREKAFKILNSAPENSDLNVLYNRFSPRSERVKKMELFMYATGWSDVIRNRTFKVRHKTYNHGDWHYADIFWKQANGKAVMLENFPEKGGKAIKKLYDFEKIMRSSTYKNEEKAIALAWFLHVGGDIHNPVHNASRVTKLSLKGDRGGNRFMLIPRTENQRGLNLHSYWDSIITRNIRRKNDACDTDYILPIAKKITKKYPYSKLKNDLKLTDYKEWNMEGYKLLNEVVYTPNLVRNKFPPKKYNKKAYKVALKQFALAGYRLGESLNMFFRDKQSKSTK